MNTFFSFFFLTALLFCTQIEAQDLKKIKEFRSGKIENVAIDRLGNFFLVFKSGTIKKYDLNGKVLAELKKGSLPTLLEPWFHPKIFLYQQLDQQYTILDHNLQEPEKQKIDEFVAINPILACPTNDNKLLVLDGADLSIKKVNPVTHEVMAEFYIDSVGHRINFVDMKEYQNLIFLLNKNSEIIIYNTLGKKINQLETHANNFGFFGEELYFLQPGKIVFFDLYTEKTRELKIPNAKYVLVSDERILLVDEANTVSIFEFSGNLLKE